MNLILTLIGFGYIGSFFLIAALVCQWGMNRWDDFAPRYYAGMYLWGGIAIFIGLAVSPIQIIGRAESDWSAGTLSEAAATSVGFFLSPVVFLAAAVGFTAGLAVLAGAGYLVLAVFSRRRRRRIAAFVADGEIDDMLVSVSRIWQETRSRLAKRNPSTAGISYAENSY